jgi:hypothetical protein
MPALNVRDEDIDRMLATLDEVLADLAETGSHGA